MGGAVPGPTWGAAATTTHSLSSPPRPPSLSSPPFALTALRKVSGSPRRLLAQGVQSPGPSGRGVGEGSLSGRRSATANFGCARLGTRGACVGGCPETADPTRRNRSHRGGGTRPRRGRPGQGAGAGAARAARAAGVPAPAPTAAPESIFPTSPRGGDPPAPQLRQRGPPPPQPPPPTILLLPWPGCGPGAGATVTGERSARAQIPGARRRRLPLLPPPLPPPGSQAPDRSPPPRALPAPPGARRAGLGLRPGAERSRREPGCGAHCVKHGASPGRRRGPRAASPEPAGQAGQRRLRLRLRLRIGRGRGIGGRGSAEIVAHSF